MHEHQPLASLPHLLQSLPFCSPPHLLLPFPLHLTPQVKAYTGPAELAAALQGCELVVIPAGVPRKPGMTRDDLFNINAGDWVVGWVGLHV